MMDCLCRMAENSKHSFLKFSILHIQFILDPTKLLVQLYDNIPSLYVEARNRF